MATFNNGDSIRQLFSYLALAPTGRFIFSKNDIRYGEVSGDGSILNEVVIRGYDLIKYKIDGPHEKFLCSVSMQDLNNSLKGSSKKSGVRLEKYKNKNQIYLAPTESAGNGDYSGVTTLSINNYTRYHREFNRGVDEYNCIVDANKFCDACYAMFQSKFSTAQIIGYERGLCIIGQHQGGGAFKQFEFGTVVDNEDAELPRICTYEFPVSILKSLKPISKLSNHGTIKIYLEPERNGVKEPIRLVANIGSFGLLSVDLKQPTM
jgi:hypothetical protein